MPNIPANIKIFIEISIAFSIIEFIPKFVKECRQNDNNWNPKNNPNNFKDQKQSVS